MIILTRLAPFALVLAATPALAEMPSGISHLRCPTALRPW